MLNRYPWWKYFIIALVVVPGIFYALPNLFGDDPGVQIRGSRNTSVTSETLEIIENTLKDSVIEYKSVSLNRDAQSIRIKFADTEKQLQARDALQRELGSGYAVALTLLPSTPGWLQSVGALPMYLGLDLRGGVHFLMEVDMDSVNSRAEKRYVDDVRREMREAKIRYKGVRNPQNGGVEVTLRDAAQRENTLRLLRTNLPELSINPTEPGDTIIRGSVSEAEIERLRAFAVDQNMTALRNRIDELGVAEPVVQRQGTDRIVIQLPGVQDTARAKIILGRTATLEVMLVNEDVTAQAAQASGVPPGSKIFRFRDGTPVLLKNRVIYSGDNIIDAAASLDTQNGTPIVSITLDAVGAKINQRVTGENINKRMAVLYIENRSETRKDEDGNAVLDDAGKPVKVKTRIEEVITAPVIRDQLGKRFQIEGLDSVEEARDLSLMLRAGALAAPVEIVEERTVGPSLGQQNIKQGQLSVIAGFLLVLIFMVLYYRFFGIVANVALVLNLVLMVAVLSLLQATLTLPGVAGIVLTVGMAVDANVLIFERIREELRNGNTPQASIHVGYDRALSTIVDANVTTLIAAIVLFNFGTGPIKGFAVTLSIGILTSMFTAIMVTRGIVNWWYGGKRIEELPI